MDTSIPITPRDQRLELQFCWRGDDLRAQVDGEGDSFEISLGYWTRIAVVEETLRAESAQEVLRRKTRFATTRA